MFWPSRKSGDCSGLLLLRTRSYPRSRHLSRSGCMMMGTSAVTVRHVMPMAKACVSMARSSAAQLAGSRAVSRTGWGSSTPTPSTSPKPCAHHGPKRTGLGLMRREPRPAGVARLPSSAGALCGSVVNLGRFAGHYRRALGGAKASRQPGEPDPARG
jgi:hypothetical protein